MPTDKPKLPRHIPQGEAQVGDIISLEFAYKGWDMAKVTAISDHFITVFRPHMTAGQNGYPYIGVEIFTMFRESNNKLLLIGRDE